MALSDVTGEAVLRAIAEFDQLGRQAFLDKYGSGRARAYSLLYQGNRYDSKAIVGAAHQLATGRSLNLRGGKVMVAPTLEKLGFTVQTFTEGLTVPGPESPGFGAWLLKCNPDVWPIEEAIAGGIGPDLSWSVHRNRMSESMAAGDPVVFWISGPTGAQPVPGIWGIGTVRGPIEQGVPDDRWIDVERAAKAEWFVPIEIEFFDEPISRDDLKQHPELSGLAVIRFPNGPNPSRVTAAQWRALQGLFHNPPSAESPGVRKPADRAAVEQAAIAAVTTAYEKDGWQIDDVQHENCGWDLTATRGDQIDLVEVKGRAGDSQLVLLSRNELRAAEEEPGWQLAIVTNALTNPEIHWWDSEAVVETSVPVTYVFTGAFTGQ